jgi:hypothetical protein
MCYMLRDRDDHEDESDRDDHNDHAARPENNYV